MSTEHKPEVWNDKVESLAPGTPPELTYGEKAVGLTFNPGGKEEVNKIKSLCALVIDELNNQRAATENGEVKAQFTIAIRSIQEGKMWGVKAATWQY